MLGKATIAALGISLSVVSFEAPALPGAPSPAPPSSFGAAADLAGVAGLGGLPSEWLLLQGRTAMLAAGDALGIPLRLRVVSA
jgi:hypothetical protein